MMVILLKLINPHVMLVKLVSKLMLMDIIGKLLVLILVVKPAKMVMETLLNVNLAKTKIP